MAKLSKGTTFSDGSSANAAALNNLVDNATVLAGIITDWGAVTPDVADSILIYDSSAANLAKCTLANVISLIPSSAVAGTPALRALGAGSTDAAAGNDSRFPASVTGLRKGAGAGSSDTAAGPNDMRFASSNLGTGTDIDWSLADIFYSTSLDANKTYTFSNVTDGRVIMLLVNQNSKTITLPGGWTTIGTANIAGWNIYTFIKSTGASFAT
jgi:hypothetical protein